MCRIQDFNNMCSADFVPFILGSRSLVRQEVDGDRGAARQRRLAGMRFEERKTHGLSCNEARVSRRGRFLFIFFLRLHPLSSLAH